MFDRLLIVVNIILYSILAIRYTEIHLYFHFFEMLYANVVVYLFCLFSFIYLVIKNFKSIVIDYLRPYYYIFKQYNYMVPFIILFSLFF